MRKILREESLPEPEEALSLAISTLPPKSPPIVEVPLLDSLGRISAVEVSSPIDLPPFSRSTVDGYALKASNTPGKLRITGKVSIGEEPTISIEGGQCVEVDTGSMLPQGSDAVVKVEDVKVLGEEVEVAFKVPSGLNVAWVGSDLAQGEVMLSSGELITSEKIAALAAVGIDRVKVFGGFRIAIISTGNELWSPGSPLPPAHIYESNGMYLASRLRELGHRVDGPLLVKDDYNAVKGAIEDAVKRSDVVLVTGGTSAGERDYVHMALSSLGKVVFHGIRFKPGKPTIMAVVDGKPVFGLPGNPASTVMVFDRVVNRYLSPHSLNEPMTMKGRLATAVKADRNRHTYVPIYLFKSKDGWMIYPIRFDSHMIGTLSSSDGYLALKPGEIHEAGEEVEARVLKLDPRPVVLGEEDPSFTFSKGVRKLLVGSKPACDGLRYGFGDVLVISSLMCSPDSSEYSMKREVNWVGDGMTVGYVDWVGMSLLAKDAQVKVKSPSIALKLVNRGRVLIPSTYAKGEERVAVETLHVLVGERAKGLWGLNSSTE